MVRRILNTLGVAAICLFAGQEAAAGVPDCKAIARAAEERHGLPDGILQSISTVEASRIQPDGSYRAWPWTLNDNGKGLFFDDREQVLLVHLDAARVVAVDGVARALLGDEERRREGELRRVAEGAARRELRGGDLFHGHASAAAVDAAPRAEDDGGTPVVGMGG